MAVSFWQTCRSDAARVPAILCSPDEPRGYVNPVDLEEDLRTENSDNDSVEQYAGIDPGKFNEDGSFIGQRVSLSVGRWMHPSIG